MRSSVIGLTDSEVIARSGAVGDAFELIFERHYASVHRFLAGRVDSLLAEELAAETMMVAFDRRSSYRHEYSCARPWLLGIATNLLRRHRRSEQARFRAYARAPCEASSDALDLRAIEAVDAAGAVSRVAQGLERMRRGDRDALLLLAWGELSYEEIAGALEIPIGTVRSRIARARKRLRELLGDLTAIEEREDDQQQVSTSG